MEPLKLKITSKLHTEMQTQLAQILRKTALGREQIPLCEIMAFDTDFKATRLMAGYCFLTITNEQSLKACSYVINRVIFIVGGQPGARALLVNHANSVLANVNVLLEA